MWPSIRAFLPVQHRAFSCHILFYCMHIIMIKINVKKLRVWNSLPMAVQSSESLPIFSTPPENWTVRAFLQLTAHLSNNFPADFLRWPQPWSLLTIMLLWHSFLIIIIILLLLFLCVPNLKLLASMVAEINTGSVYLRWLERCVSSEKIFVMQNLGIWGQWGRGLKICHRKCHIWNRQPWFAYSLCHFYGPRMTIKGRLLLSATIIKHFQSEKNVNSAFGLNCDSFGG